MLGTLTKMKGGEHQNATTSNRVPLGGHVRKGMKQRKLERTVQMQRWTSGTHAWVQTGNFFRSNRGQIIVSSSDKSASSQDSFRTAREGSIDVFEFLVDMFKYVDDTTIVEAMDTCLLYTSPSPRDS